MRQDRKVGKGQAKYDTFFPLPIQSVENEIKM